MEIKHFRSIGGLTKSKLILEKVSEKQIPGELLWKKKMFYLTYSKHTFSSFFPPGRLGIVITFALAHIVPRLNNGARIFIKSHLNFYIPTYYFTRLILILICTLVFPRHWNARYFREYFSNNFNLATISIIALW